ASSVPYLCHRPQRRPWTGLSRPQIGLSLGIIFAIHRVVRTPTASISGRGIRAAPAVLPRAGVDIGGRRSRWHRPRPPGSGENADPRRPRSAVAESRRRTGESRPAPVAVFVPPPGHVPDTGGMTVTAPSPMKLLDRMYNDATSTADQGTRFERFTQSFLQTDPLWASQFAKVWMWDQWPEKWGHDSGIDLVAERRDGGLTAIQCKFFAP